MLERINLIKLYAFLEINNRRANYTSTSGLTVTILREKLLYSRQFIIFAPSLSLKQCTENVYE
jgi:hypothetical protein